MRQKRCYFGSGNKWRGVIVWAAITETKGKADVDTCVGAAARESTNFYLLKNAPGEKVVNVLWVYPTWLNKCQETCRLVLNLMDTRSSWRWLFGAQQQWKIPCLHHQLCNCSLAVNSAHCNHTSHQWQMVCLTGNSSVTAEVLQHCKHRICERLITANNYEFNRWIQVKKLLNYSIYVNGAGVVQSYALLMHILNMCILCYFNNLNYIFKIFLLLEKWGVFVKLWYVSFSFQKGHISYRNW
jgi:hypothetical protein